MKMNKKVSIIIPIYNTANFLSECLDSVINQTYTNLEIILINDGSSDDSEKICQLYAKTDKRIIYFYKENSGVSSTRNLGIEKSSGDFICFVDSDDIVSPNFIMDFIANIENETDFVCCNLRKFSNKNVIKYDENAYIKNSYEGNEKYRIIYEDCQAYMPNRLYNSNLLKKNKIYFDENIQMCEDLLFNLKYLSSCEKVIHIKKANYFYRIYSSSASKCINNKRWFGIYDVLLYMFDKYDFFDEHTKKKFIYFCNTTLIEGNIRRKKTNDINTNLSNENEIKRIVNLKQCNMYFKDYIKYMLYKLFPTVILKYKLKKVD